jgi:hypothetical protein
MMIRIETGVNVEVQVGLIIKLENKGGEPRKRRFVLLLVHCYSQVLSHTYESFQMTFFLTPTLRHTCLICM